MCSLSRVLTALQKQDIAASYMGFRDTKLTRLLQPVFTQKCFITWLICISLASSVKVGSFLLR